MSGIARQHLEAIFRAGIAACQADRVLPPHLPDRPKGRAILLALGKAAVPMAKVVENYWGGPLTGLAVTPHGTEAPLERVDVMTAAHPLPDAANVKAAERMLALAGAAGEDDLVLVLLSGGASALTCLPSEGLSLDAKRTLTEALLRSGASIAEINCVRRHLSRFKGGRLAAAAHPARIVTLAISDVAGDKPEDIGSGPTVADPTCVEDARAILRRLGIADPGGWGQSVKRAEAAAWKADYRIVASARIALEAAAGETERLGYRARIVGECQGEARKVAAGHAEMAREASAGTALISGGELTVTIHGSGTGGPNQEYALALAGSLGEAGFAALAADSDGIDGMGEAAGAFADATTLGRAAALGLDPARALGDNDSGAFFAALGDLFVTGPTGTNVNDLRIVLIGP